MARPPRPPRFDAAWNRRRVWGKLWRRWSWRLGLLLALMGAALWLWRPEAGGGAGEWVRVDERFALCGTRGANACVVDGDTVRIGQRRIRLEGYDAPELAGACDAERLRARDATSALLAWLNRGAFEWSGGADPPRDQHGRELRSARRGGEPLAQTMVARGLAEGNGWDRERIDWCAP